MKPCANWTAIVITCQRKDIAYAFHKELELRKRRGDIDQSVALLSIDDPSTKVGSGGATLNALLVVTEYISAQRGYTVVSADVLKDSHILIVNMGRAYLYEACGQTFIAYPAQPRQRQYEKLLCHIDLLLYTMTYQIAIDAPPGLWVVSTEMIVSLQKPIDMKWGDFDAVVMSTKETMSACKNHGIYQIDSQGNVEDIFYRTTDEMMKLCSLSDGSIPILCGIVYLSLKVCNEMLSLYFKPLDACTFMGEDSGKPPLELSFFFDVMLPMASKVEKHVFVSGSRSGQYGQEGQSDSANREIMISAREILWNHLSHFKIKCHFLEDGSFHFQGESLLNHHKYLLDCPMGDNHSLAYVTPVVHSYIEDSVIMSDKSIVINSSLKGDVTLRKDAVLCHSSLKGNITVGKSTILNVNFSQPKKSKVIFPENILVSNIPITIRSTKHNVHVICGLYDNLHVPRGDSLSTFCNMPWSSLFNRADISSDDIWPSFLNESNCTLYNAKLFPVMNINNELTVKNVLWLAEPRTPDSDAINCWRSSWRLSIQDILSVLDVTTAFICRQKIFYEISESLMDTTFTNCLNNSFMPLYASAYVEGYSEHLLTKLDNISLNTNSPGILARSFANIANVLAYMANRCGGLRSGPAANKLWLKAFSLLEAEKYHKGTLSLIDIRRDWLRRPDLLIRAARHYEAAAHKLIGKAVLTAKKFFHTLSVEMIDIDNWVTVECPARIDIAGGWSDTPPICYEHQGTVTNVAVKINGKKPIGAKARRIPEPKLKFVIHKDGGGLSSSVEVTDLEQLRDYSRPMAPAALLKAAICCMEIVDLTSCDSLADQLIQNYDGGFELHTWSHLPQGSGMGSSSILAAAIIQAVLMVSGKSVTTSSLIHAVLILEQMLSTAGGWQDALGGLLPGIKTGFTQPRLPLKVECQPIVISDEFLKDLNQRMLLIFSGQSRLARNIVQDVIRNWYSRSPEFQKTVDRLVKIAVECNEAFNTGNMTKIAAIINEYWILKKQMTPGTETDLVGWIMTALQPYCLAMTLTGAGGGGFVFALLKDTNQETLSKLRSDLDVLKQSKGCGNIDIYDVEIDNEGMVTSVQE